MNRLAILISLLALALNVAAGHSGSMLFCEHESGESHLVSSGDHAADSHETACHQHDSTVHLNATGNECCDSCIDVEVGGDELQDLVRSTNQDRVSAPPVLSVEFFGFDSPELFDSGLASTLPATRAPPVGDSLTNLQIKRTVLRL
ncbi:hypothetical protein [Pelagicoccus sp. SDUM812002]|uniref:hypothetical protein n=1 Tax=Pelagicoccus sp. SDUM812002 TaxID=3041266 RepID=UPI00280D6ED0|nr:hypothetical protein [Pelagicoccus sp. SDUM812002]MDQ8184171.1 hypothetical protein [Pelagicoccus sp. SDUM812002]